MLSRYFILVNILAALFGFTGIKNRTMGGKSVVENRCGNDEEDISRFDQNTLYTYVK